MGWRIVLIPLVSVILVSATAGGMAPHAVAQQTIALEAPPKWDVGDQWTWQLGNDRVTWTVLGAGGEYVVRQKSATETGIIHLAADFSSTRESALFFLPQFYQLQFPLTLGKEWKYRTRGSFGYTSGGESELEVTRIAEGVVSITVPAGTFDSVRIFGRSHAYKGQVGNQGFGATFNPAPTADFIVWYAPKLKQVARITWQGNLWFGPYAGNSLLLVSYKLHNP